MPREAGLQFSRFVRPRSADAITSPVTAFKAHSRPPQSPTYTFPRATEGAEAIGPLSFCDQRSRIPGAEAGERIRSPAATPFMESDAQYLGQSLTGIADARRLTSTSDRSSVCPAAGKHTKQSRNTLTALATEMFRRWDSMGTI